MRLSDADKVIHAKGGLAVAIFGLLFGLAASFTTLHPATACTLAASIAVALAIEGAQWVENRAGHVPTRQVSAADAFATAYPGCILAAVFELGIRHYPGLIA